MGRVRKYPDELRERAVRMVAEVCPQYPSQWAANTAVAGMLGIGTPETLRTRIRRSEVDTGQRPGVTSQMAEEHKALPKEIAELRRANVGYLESSCDFLGPSSTGPRDGDPVHRRTQGQPGPAPTVGPGCAGVSSPCVRCSPSTVRQSARRPTTSGSPRPRRGANCGMPPSRDRRRRSGRGVHRGEPRAARASKEDPGA